MIKIVYNFESFENFETNANTLFASAVFRTQLVSAIDETARLLL